MSKPVTSEVVAESNPSPVVALAVVNYSNRPLFTRVYEHPDWVLPSPRTGETREQQLHYLLFRSLDFIPGQGKSAREMTADGYLGCVNPQEPLPVFAYVTNTGLKILLATTSRGINDIKLKEILRSIHKLYIANLLNPFYVYNTPVSSMKFANKLDELRSLVQ
ncbi:Trafficking protein particle complex subunit 2-like protein [Galdieria sulphuraria]|uniref:Trafficking protein particle complex subunit 2-like protein n=1 Tax=Galdieria sulphuraria TaxID=130081 RepID=M2Y4E6_GALSU|nr:trafficking protein particle complex subunit 2-like protein [Galdieria sulphuraria]EME30818.1 trafficking protein particle complex subunit 2-like protein [Galdieria sulphuraria]GJD08240.1 Trafficking protein particle complex subunit 2-like protein [Galdieria sulphuraria]|eukprot:XP_005707338.1 trafficking protein particle complex subunit 2-like protein [Galdieria sulphuraria]